MKPLLERVRWYKYQFLFLGCSAILLVATILSFSYVIDRANLRSTPVRAANGDISWRVFDGGVDDPGANYSESTITTGNANWMAKLWSASLPATTDNAPVEEANVSTGQGTVDLVFVNTVKGNLVAFNAATGAKVWEADPSTADFNGQGTKSSPAIDSSGSYIYAYAVDGYVHKYNIGNGTEVSGTGFPAQVTLLPNNIEKESASLNIANGYLYATISGNDGDYGHYVGHVVAVNLSSGTKTVWNSECSNITVLEDATSGDSNYCSSNMSGIWARPGVKVDPVTGNVFVATGNGNYNANGGGFNWGDSIIELKPDLSQIVDSYTPTTYASLDSSDADLGSTAPVILPTQSGSNTPYMLVQAGKDHIVRLLNRSNLSGQGGPGHTGGELQTITISDETHEQPAVWKDSSGTTWVYVTDESGDTYAYTVATSGGTSSLHQAYHLSNGVSSSPFVANGVLYFSGNSLLAYNATTGVKLFDSNSVGISFNQHWESPTVVNGTVFSSNGNSTLYAFYVPGAQSSGGGGGSGGSSGGSSSGSGGGSSSSSKPSSSSPTKPTTTPTSITPVTPTAHPTNHTTPTTPLVAVPAPRPTGLAAVWVAVTSPVITLLHLRGVSNFISTKYHDHDWLIIVSTIILLLLCLSAVIFGSWSLAKRLRTTPLPLPADDGGSSIAVHTGTGTALPWLLMSQSWCRRVLRHLYFRLR